jgi:DNA-binding CsgD family transcriptional regulator
VEETVHATDIAFIHSTEPTPEETEIARAIREEIRVLMPSLSSSDLHSIFNCVACNLATARAKKQLKQPEAPAPWVDILSPRERVIAAMLRQGIVLPEISRRIGCSKHTARNHLKHIFRKMGVRSQVELLSRIAELSPEDIRGAQ